MNIYVFRRKMKNILKIYQSQIDDVPSFFLTETPRNFNDLPYSQMTILRNGSLTNSNLK